MGRAGQGRQGASVVVHTGCPEGGTIRSKCGGACVPSDEILAISIHSRARNQMRTRTRTLQMIP